MKVHSSYRAMHEWQTGRSLQSNTEHVPVPCILSQLANRSKGPHLVGWDLNMTDDMLSLKSGAGGEGGEGGGVGGPGGPGGPSGPCRQQTQVSSVSSSWTWREWHRLRLSPCDLRTQLGSLCAHDDTTLLQRTAKPAVCAPAAASKRRDPCTA